MNLHASPIGNCASSSSSTGNNNQVIVEGVLELMNEYSYVFAHMIGKTINLILFCVSRRQRR